MAEDDIIIKVRVDGEEEANAALQNLARGGDAAFAKLASGTQQVTAAFSRMTQEINRFKPGQFDQLPRALEQTSAAAQQVSGTFQQLGQQLGQMRLGALEQMPRQLEQLSSSAKQVSGSFQQLGQQLGQLRLGSVDQLPRAMQQAAQAAGQASTAFKGLNNTVLDGVTSFAQATQKVALMGSTAAEALETAARAAKHFGASAADLQNIEARIRAINARAKDTGSTFQEAAQRFDEGAQKFARGGQAISGVSPILDAVSNRWNIAGRAAQQAAQEVASAFARAAAAGKSTQQALQDAFKADAGRLAAKDIQKLVEILVTLEKEAKRTGATLTESMAKAAAATGEYKGALSGVVSAQRAVGRSLENTGQAAEQTTGRIVGLRLGLSQFATVATQVGVPMGSLGAALAGIGLRFGPAAAAATAAAAALASFGAAAATAAEHAKDLARTGAAIGTSFKETSALQQTFARGGTSAAEFSSSMQSLGAQVRETMRSVAADAASGFSGYEQASRRVAQAERALQSTMERGSQAFKEANYQRQRLRIENERAVDAGNAANAANVKNRKELAAVSQQAAASAADAARQEIQARQAVRDAYAQEQAQREAVADARHAEFVRSINDLDTVARQFERIGQGAQVAFSPLVEGTSKVQALALMLGKAGVAAQESGQDFAQMSDAAAQGFAKVADVFKALPEGEAFDLAKRMNLLPMFEQLRRGGAELLATRQRIKDLGLALDDTDKQNLQGFNRSLNTLSSTLGALQDKFGAGVAPGFAEAMDRLTRQFEVLGPLVGPVGTAVGTVLPTAFAAATQAALRLYPPLQLVVNALNLLKGLQAPAVGRFLDDLLSIGKARAAEPPKPGEAVPGDVADLATLQNTIEEMRRLMASLQNELVNFAGQAAQAVEQMFTAILPPVRNVIDTILGWIREAAEALASLIRTATGGGGTAAATAGGFARGGLFQGKHGGVDTNLAWLSRGEFVFSTRAVRYWGPRLLQMMNALQSPLHFAGGGMVPALARSSAAVGLSSSQVSTRNLNLVIEGKLFSGLKVPEQTAVALERFAVNSQIASAGRKPNWRR